jgi:GAF domain-containing protein
MYSVRKGRTLYIPVMAPGTNRSLLAQEHDEVSEVLDVTSLISAPLKARGEVIGTLNIARTERNAPPYEPADRAFLEELANRAGVAIDNARLFRTVQAATRLQARAELAGDVGHDLNNLLTVIRGYVQLAQQRLGEDGAHELAEVQRAADRAAELVRELLAFSDGRRRDRA